MAGLFSWRFLCEAGDFSVELEISQCFLIRGCMGHRVGGLDEMGISLWSWGFLSGS